MPFTLDLEKLRAASHVVSFSDLQETVIPTEKRELILQKMDDFEVFGTFVTKD